MTQTVLLVEDEPLLREVTSEDLHDLGFATLCAHDSDDAIAYLKGDQSLVAMITDIRMPGSHDGWSLAVCARELRPDLPVIYLSGYADDAQDPVHGAVFVQKPYRLKDIEAALKQVGLA